MKTKETMTKLTFKTIAIILVMVTIGLVMCSCQKEPITLKEKLENKTWVRVSDSISSFKLNSDESSNIKDYIPQNNVTNTFTGQWYTIEETNNLNVTGGYVVYKGEVINIDDNNFTLRYVIGGEISDIKFYKK